MKKATEPFVMLPRNLLHSAAWRGLGLQARRLVDFLMLEHLRHGGQRNGHLVAPHRQLVEFGIYPAAVASAIKEASDAGLVDVVRGEGRSASRYTLTWLPLPGGMEASNRWQHVAEKPKTPLRNQRVNEPDAHIQHLRGDESVPCNHPA